jgi:hypothetical protein
MVMMWDEGILQLRRLDYGDEAGRTCIAAWECNLTKQDERSSIISCPQVAMYY